MQPAIPTRVPHFSRHLAGFRTYPPRYSYLFTLLFTCKLECMKLAAYPPQAIPPLSACTTRPLPFYSPTFHAYIFYTGYYTLFTYSLARSPLAFPPVPAVLDLIDFVAFGTGADRKPGPLPAVA